MNTARFFTMLLLVLSLGVSSAYAQDEEAPAEEAAAAEETVNEGTEKVNTDDLEKKYWAPSDQGYTVVQDRTYTKAGKFGVSILGGPMLMYDWYNGFNFGAAFSYHFNERWGVEGVFNAFSLSEIDAVKEIDRIGGAMNRGKVENYIGVSGRWVPFYSKMSFLGSQIVYFDMSFGLNVGIINYEQQILGGNESQMSPAVGFDISQTYFITPSFAIRADYSMKFFNEEVVTYNPSFPGEEEDKMTSYTTFNLGLTYLF